MKTIYFKYPQQNGAIAMEKQKAAKVINETNGVVTAEYEINGKKETRAFCEGQYSEVPYLMSF